MSERLTGKAQRSDADAPARDDSGRAEARARLHARLFAQPEGARELGRYRLREPVGSGGMGTVWRAQDTKLGREVAIKLLHEGALSRPVRARRQLFAEAALMARLTHPNVVRVYDVGEHEGELFIAMEFVRGRTLRSWQQQRERSWREIVEVYVAAGAGLAAAHQAGLVHGDFKPDNVLIGDDGRVLVTDFAVTRHVLEAQLELELSDTFADTPPDELGSGSRTILRAEATHASARLPLVMGTPAYMAPEQFDGKLGDAKADQFAFCVAMWEALAGERPFRGRSWSQLRQAIDAGPHAERRKGPRSLWAILERGLAIPAAQRWPSFEVLLARLRWLQGRRRRVGLISAGAGLAALGFAAAIPAMQGEVEVTTVAVVQQCDPAEAAVELGALWSADHRKGVREAFAATGLPYASAAADTTIARLDAWGQAWTDARAQACTSTDANSRLRLVCLDRNRASFAELVSVLSEADAGTVERAHELLDLLPEAQACQDFELPHSEQASDPAQLERVAQLEARVDRARFLWLVARTDAGLAEVEAVLGAAETTQAVGVVAEARLLRGLLWLDAGKDQAGKDELFAAGLLARKAAVPAVEAEALWNLAEAEALRGGGQPERWLELAGFAVEAEPSARLRAELATYRGLVANYAAKPSEARAWFAQALSESRDAPASKRINYLANYGGILIELDEIDRGVEILREALSLASEHWPSGHPDIGLIHNSVAVAEFSRGEFSAAYTEFQRALEALVPVFGHDHVYVHMIRMNLAHVESELGHCDEARRGFDDLIAALRRDLDAAGLLLPNTLVRRALVCDAVEPNSIAWADEALERANGLFPERGLGWARIAAHRAWVLLLAGELAQAEQAFAVAQPIFAAELDEDNAERAWIDAGLGLALAGQGRAEARALLEGAKGRLGPRRKREAAKVEAALSELDSGKLEE